jgi:WD40 repeat protein
MAVPITCPQCGKSLQLSDSALGKTIRCPGCQKTFKAPPAAVVTAPPAPSDRGSPRPDDHRMGLPAKKGGGAGAIVAILGAVLVACGSIGTLGFFVIKGVHDAKNADIPDSAWQTYQPPRARCTVSMPGTPRASAITAAPVSAGSGKEYLLSLNRPSRNFTLTVADISRTGLRGWGPNPLMRLAASERDWRTRTTAGSRLVEDTPSTHAGQASRTFRIDTPSNESIAVLVVLKLWADGSGTLATLRVQGVGVRLDSPEVVRYFESLRFEKDTMPPGPDPSPGPRDLNEALAWLTGNDPANRKKAAGWLDRQGVVEGRRAHVARALLAALARNTDAGMGDILKRNLAKWRPMGVKPPADPDAPKLNGSQLTVHAGGTRLVRYSPDGSFLAALGADGVLKILEVPGFKVRTTVSGITGEPRDIACSKDGQLIAIAAGDAVQVFNAIGGERRALLASTQPVAVSFFPGTKKIAVASQKSRVPDRDGEVRFHDVEANKADGEPIKLPRGVRDLAWAPDRSVLAVASGGEVILFEPGTRKPRKTIAAHPGPITGLAFSQDTRMLATSGAGDIVKLWSPADGSLLGALEAMDNPTGRPAFSPDGKVIVTSDFSKPNKVPGLHVWYADTCTGISKTYTLAGRLTCITVGGKDGPWIAYTTENSKPVHLWLVSSTENAFAQMPSRRDRSTRSPREVARLNLLGGSTDVVRFSPDGQTLATGSSEGTLMLMNVSDWKLKAYREANRKGLAFAYSGDGSRLIAAAGGPRNARVYLRDGPTGKLKGDFPAGDGKVRCLALSADGKRLAVGFDAESGPGGTVLRSLVRLWDIAGEPKPLGTLEGLPGTLGGLAFSADGQTLHAAAGRSLRRWKADTREELPALGDVSGTLVALAVSPDGSVWAGGDDGVIRSWAADGKPGHLLEGHKGGLIGLTLTADGKRLASFGRDGSLRLWDTRSGAATAFTTVRTEQSIRPEPLVRANELPAFSPDGTLIAVTTDDGKVAVLRVGLIRGKPPEPPKGTAFKPSREANAVASLDPPRSAFFNAVLFKDNGTLLALSSTGALQWFDWPAGKLLSEVNQTNTITLLRSRDGKVIAAYFRPHAVLRDGDTGKLLPEVKLPQLTQVKNYGAIRCAALAPDGDLLAVSLQLDRENELVVWDIKEARQRSAVRLKGSPVSLAFSPNGKTLAVAQSSSVVLYEPRELKEGKKIEQQKVSFSSVSFSPDGKKLATSSSRTGQVKMWDVAEGKELWSSPGTEVNMDHRPLTFSPDGKWLAVAKRGRMVLLNAADGKVRVEVTRVVAPGSAPSFTPDGKYLAVVRGSRYNIPLIVYDVEKLLAAPAP